MVQSAIYYSIPLYPERVDREHEKNIGKLGEFVVDWTHSRNEHRRIWESVRALEMRGYLETKIRKQKEGKEKGIWGGTQKWMEVRIKRKEIRG